MRMDEIVFPETKPETEWVRGRALRKMSPTFAHGRLQFVFAIALDAWARRRGHVATEWRFRVAPPGEVRRPLVPDVAFLSFVRADGLTEDELEVPPLASDVAVEILSKGDRAIDLDSKIDVYLRGGASLVVVADGDAREITLVDGVSRRTLGGSDVLRHDALPDFELALDAYFARALDRER